MHNSNFFNLTKYQAKVYLHYFFSQIRHLNKKIFLRWSFNLHNLKISFILCKFQSERFKFSFTVGFNVKV